MKTFKEFIEVLEESGARERAPTKKQQELIKNIEKWADITIMPHTYYVKNRVIGIYTHELDQNAVNNIIRYGHLIGAYTVEPNGYKSIALVMPK